MAFPSVTQVPFGRGGFRTSIQFGGLPVPIGNLFSGSSMPYVDVNDGVSFFAQALDLPDGHTLQMARLMYRGRAIKLTDDHEPVIVGVPFQYEETVQSLQAARAILITAGTQYLTFDGGVKGILCDCQSLGKTQTIRNAISVPGQPLAWEGALAFLCKEPFFRDIASTTIAATNTPASSGGTATTINVSYAGSFWAEPFYTIVMPTIASTNVTFVINNTTAGLALTIVLPADGNTYVVDTGLLQVYRQGNTAIQIQHTGSFPFLYNTPQFGPTLTNAIQVTATCPTACTPTVAISYQNRWAD